ncbi:MAG: hypothetical protein ACLSVD_14235 [Eggerthellaceae bacterium]
MRAWNPIARHRQPPAATSENWSLARMPIVDRSILRLATFG